MERMPERIDSKFRFILVAAERAKQIQWGAPPRMDVKSTKPAFIAIKEVESDMVPYEVLEEDDRPDIQLDHAAAIVTDLAVLREVETAPAQTARVRP